MADPQDQQQPDVDVVQHPTLGTLKFPKSMPYQQRNDMIADMERKATSAQPPSVGSQIMSGIGTGLKNTLIGAPVAAWETGKQAGEFMQQHPILGAIPGVAPAVGAYKALYQQPTDQAVNAINAHAAAHHMENSPAATEGRILAHVPIVGPMAVNLGAKAAGTPETNTPPAPLEAVAEGLTYAAAPEVARLGKGAVGSYLAGKAPELYKSSLKPSVTLPISETDKLVNTGLKEGIPISRSGLAKTQAKIGGLENEISDVIGRNPTAPISPTKVARRVDQIQPTFATQVNPESDLNNLSRTKSEFLRQHTTEQPFTKIAFRPVDEGETGAVPIGKGSVKRIDDIPAERAQEIKRGTYRQLGEQAYGSMKPSEVEGQKALARGIREELEGPFPELKGLNAREGALVELQDAIQRAVQRTSNYEPMGIQAPLAGAGVKAVGGSNPMALTAGAGMAILRNPLVRSQLAIALSKAGVPRASVVPRIAAVLGAATSGQNENQATVGRP